MKAKVGRCRQAVKRRPVDAGGEDSWMALPEDKEQCEVPRWSISGPRAAWHIDRMAMEFTCVFGWVNPRVLLGIGAT